VGQRASTSTVTEVLGGLVERFTVETRTKLGLAESQKLALRTALVRLLAGGVATLVA
jgi:hypothetical protein